MTRRLGGIEGKVWAALASLSLAVAGGFAMTGCGGDSSTPTEDAGDAGEGGFDSPVDSAPDAGGDAAKEAAPGQCATPSFMPGAGAVAPGTSVTITSANLPAGGFIFYTTDGTLPSHASPALTSGSSITITSNVTVHAIAFGATCSDSNVATAAYTLILSVDAGPDTTPPPQCPTPSFAPNGMNPIPPGSNVTIAAAGLPMGGFIYYTTDGTNPSRTSLVYSGPVQVNQSETIRAFSAATTCTDSLIAGANFVTSVPDGGLPLPAFTPTATTETNDFLLALSETTPGALICYTLDGVTTPTCSTTATAATCTGTSQAYNAATRVSISGAVTGGGDGGVGSVTVQAIACRVGYTTTLAASQTYKLQVAVPTMVNPAPGALMFQNDSATHMTAVWPAPTLATNTPAASLQYTTDGTSMPTCGVASPGINVMASVSMPIQITGNTTFNAIGCKTGYAPSSMPDTMTYTIQLNTPVMPSSTAPFYSAPTIAVDDTANRGSGDWICTTTDGTTAPVCGTAPMGCLTGTAGASVMVTANNTTIKAIACKPGLLPSAVATGGPYVLQLSPPGLTPPGFDATTGLPITAYRIPVSGFTTPTVGQSQPITSPATPTVVAAGFFCAIKNGTPACGVNMCTTGTQLAAGAMLPAMPVATDNWSVIGCPAATAPSAAFGPSAVTTVTYSAASGALAPNITPTTAGPYMTQLSPPTVGVTPVGPAILIANTDPTTVTICYSRDGTTTPACSAGTCSAGTQVLNVAGAGAANLTFVVTSGGTLYNSATPPVVSVAGGGGSCT
ncbi:MAG: chitobiase/beta-hexosaminidase C-terminal domain-containing protein, partial [Myxococcota bacterium]|nr:chitobiase/beta-hexosaminidase C-terminal domain-containing protein [Myxococcota bacterium]